MDLYVEVIGTGLPHGADEECGLGSGVERDGCDLDGEWFVQVAAFDLHEAGQLAQRQVEILVLLFVVGVHRGDAFHISGGLDPAPLIAQAGSARKRRVVGRAFRIGKGSSISFGVELPPFDGLGRGV